MRQNKSKKSASVVDDVVEMGEHVVSSIRSALKPASKTKTSLKKKKTSHAVRGKKVA